jgi:hypothetical protein
MIGPELFTLLLLMALVTTAMTGPLINLCAGRGQVEGDSDGRVRV